MAQFARAVSDVTISTGWSIGNGGSKVNLWTAIDEAVFSDSNHVLESPSFNDYYDALLSPVSDPQTGTGHIVRYRVKKAAAAGNVRNLVISLMQGTTEIATATQSDVTSTYVTSSFTLTPTEADSITNYSDLRLRLAGTGDISATAPRAMLVSWAEVEVPDSPATTVTRSVATAASIEVTDGANIYWVVLSVPEPILPRILTTQAAISIVNTRSVSTEAAVSTTNVRSVTSEASISSGSTRTLSTALSVQVSTARTLSTSASIINANIPRLGGIMRTQSPNSISATKQESNEPLLLTRTESTSVLGATRQAGEL